MSVPAAYLGVIIIWATTPLAIKWSSEGPDFLFGVSSRMVIGVALCALIMLVLRVRLPWDRQARNTYFAAGAGIYGAMTSVYWGAQFIPSGLVSVIFGLTPIVTGIFATIWLSEQNMTVARICGMLMGIAGLSVIFINGHESGASYSLGICAVLLSVVIHSASTVAVKKIGAEMPALATTTGALLIAVPAYLLTWIVFGEGWPQVATPHAVASIVYLGIFGSALGFILYYYMLKHVEAGRAALITFVTPVLALLIGAWLNHEQIQQNVVIGTAMILSGLLFYEKGSLMLQRIKSPANEI